MHEYWLKRYHQARRDLDCRALWPSCKDAVNGDMEAARAVFRVHTEKDPAWSDLTPQERDLHITQLV